MCANCRNELLPGRDPKEWRRMFRENRLADLESMQTEKLLRRASRVLTTQSQSLEGYRIARYVDVESVLFNFDAEDEPLPISGHEPAQSRRASLEFWQRRILEELKVRAARRNANAVICLAYQYARGIGGTLMLAITGTLVQAERS